MNRSGSLALILGVFVATNAIACVWTDPERGRADFSPVVVTAAGESSQEGAQDARGGRPDASSSLAGAPAQSGGVSASVAGGSSPSSAGGSPSSMAGGSPASAAGGSSPLPSSGGAEPTGGSAPRGGGAARGSAEAGSGGVGQGCAGTSGLTFCEDFETNPKGPAVASNGWKPVTLNGSLSVDGAHAFGKNALHVHTEDGGRAFIELSPWAPPADTFFGRMRIWVKAFPSAPDYAQYTLVEASGAGPGRVRPIAGQYVPGEGALWGTANDGGPTGNWTNWQPSAPAEAGKWICVEWQLAAPNNQIKVWFDGEAKPELSVDTKNHPGGGDFALPEFDRIWFGWWLYQGGATPHEFDIWIDDIALASQQLGC